MLHDYWRARSLATRLAPAPPRKRLPRHQSPQPGPAPVNYTGTNARMPRPPALAPKPVRYAGAIIIYILLQPIRTPAIGRRAGARRRREWQREENPHIFYYSQLERALSGTRRRAAPTRVAAHKISAQTRDAPCRRGIGPAPARNRQYAGAGPIPRRRGPIPRRHGGSRFAPADNFADTRRHRRLARQADRCH